MSDIRLILMDGDGSTLQHNGSCPIQLKDFFVANPNRYLYAMATGRSLDLLRRTEIIPYLTTDIPHIVDGGSKLMFLDERILFEDSLTHHELDSLEQQLPLDDVIFMYASINHQLRFFYADDLTLWESHSLFDSAIKTQEITDFFTHLHNNLPSKVFIKVKRQFKLNSLNTNTNELNIDVTHMGVDKGSACVRLLDYLNIQPHQVLFIFNDSNDLPLINHPKLQDIITLKVGDYLPNVTANYHVDTPSDVVSILQQL